MCLLINSSVDFLTPNVQEAFSDLLGDQGTVATRPVVNDDSNSPLPFDRLANQTDGILNHLKVQHPFHQLIKGECPVIRIFITHPERGYESHNRLPSWVEEPTA